MDTHHPVLYLSTAIYGQTIDPFAQALSSCGYTCGHDPGHIAFRDVADHCEASDLNLVLCAWQVQTELRQPAAGPMCTGVQNVGTVHEFVK